MRNAAERVQAAADLGVLQLAEVAVDVEDQFVEGVVVRGLLEAEIAMHLGGDEKIPDLSPDRRQLRGPVGHRERDH